MHNYIEPLVKTFNANTNPVNAEPMAKYMKNLFPYLGIKTPLRKELFRDFVKENGLPEITELIRSHWIYGTYQNGNINMLQLVTCENSVRNGIEILLIFLNSSLFPNHGGIVWMELRAGWWESTLNAFLKCVMNTLISGWKAKIYGCSVFAFYFNYITKKKQMRC